MLSRIFLCEGLMEMFGIDTDALNTAVTTARNGGGLIKDAVGLAKTIRDAVRPAAEPVDKERIVNLVGDLSQKLAEAQIAQLELLDRLMQAETALKEAQRKHDEAKRYQLTRLPMGGFVLALKSDDTNGEPSHYLCQQCADEGKKRVLHEERFGGGIFLKCPTCRQELTLSPTRRSGISTAYDPLDY